MTIDPPIPATELDWRTTDQEEIERRRQRARDERPRVVNRDPRHPIFSNFDVHSRSGVIYQVEIRDLAWDSFSCTCVDFRVNGLATCKHVEAVRLYLEEEAGDLLAIARASGSNRLDLVPDRQHESLRAEGDVRRLPKGLRRLFATDGKLHHDISPESAVEAWRGAAETEPDLRVSQETDLWLESRQRTAEARQLRRVYEHRVRHGDWPAQETRVPLFPYQREGMLHLACAERALLADEMGLGKSVQAIAACALLHRIGRASRALIVTPGSLKAEWEQQIHELTSLGSRSLDGGRRARLLSYDREHAPFFTIASYEEMLADHLDVNARLQPDIVILDEAQRIKNWSSPTALAVKRLRSRFAFVLTGTPIEQNLDELYSLVSFLDPAIFGPLFRFNREYYEFDERGRPRGYRQLDQLRDRLRPVFLRRRKADVEAQLPGRTERFHFVPLGDSQRAAYAPLEAELARLVAPTRRQPLTAGQQDHLLSLVARLRMICDTNYILDPLDRACPKAAEIARLLKEISASPGTKVLVFSEWERMLELVRDACVKLKLGFAWHTGKVSPAQRRVEVARFSKDENCRVFLTTDGVGRGLNLPNVGVLIHCDVPWTPARLQQRVARAQHHPNARPVTVLHLVSEHSIEQRLLAGLAKHRLPADLLLNESAESSIVRPVNARERLVDRIRALLPAAADDEPEPALPVAPTADLGAKFCRAALDSLGGNLMACEERSPLSSPDERWMYVIVHAGAAAAMSVLRPVYRQLYGSAAERLEVLDRTMAEALRRLDESGLVAATHATIRTLHPPARVVREAKARALFAAMKSRVSAA
jgi:SNF2 family DNA or RNA helicase